MIFYPKISNLYKIDKGSNKCIQPVFTEKIFSDIKTWNVYEKLDGMNMCVHFCLENGIRISGKTKQTKIPTPLIEYIFSKTNNWEEILKFLELKELYLYGEGIGDKIENGSRYSKEQIFVLFDVFYKNKFHEQLDVVNIAKHFELQYVPLLKTIKTDLSVLKNTHELLKLFHKSNWGDFDNEGLVLKPENMIKDENNKRVMAKIRRPEFLLD